MENTHHWYDCALGKGAHMTKNVSDPMWNELIIKLSRVIKHTLGSLC